MGTISKCTALAEAAAEALKRDYLYANKGWGDLLSTITAVDSQTPSDDVWYTVKRLFVHCDAQKPQKLFPLCPTPEDVKPYRILQHRIGVTADAVATLLRDAGDIRDADRCDRVNVEMPEISVNPSDPVVDQLTLMINDTGLNFCIRGGSCTNVRNATLKLLMWDKAHSGRVSYWLNKPRKQIDSVCAGRMFMSDGSPELIGKERILLCIPEAKTLRIEHIGIRQNYLGKEGQKEMAIVMAIDLVNRCIRENHALRIALK